MSNTEHLNLPYIMDSQAQKHVTHNEALRVLDGVVQLSAQSVEATPPSAPESGDRHIVGAGGGWDALKPTPEMELLHCVANYVDDSWHFLFPRGGWLCWLASESALMVFDGVAWVPTAAGENFETLGVNASADSVNRLLVAADASLFTHDGSDHRMKINKSGSSDTASLVYQSNFSGRAEMGLTGNDDFGFKVSPDGSAWKQALTLNATSGQALFPHNQFTKNLVVNLLGDGGRFAGSPEPATVSAGGFVLGNSFQAYNGATFTAGDAFHHNSSTNGGSAPTITPKMADLIEFLKQPGSPRRYGPEFNLLDVTSGTGTSVPYNFEGVLHHLSQTNVARPLWSKSTWGCNIRADSGSVLISAYGNYELYVDGIRRTTSLALTDSDGWVQCVFVGTANPAAGLDYSTTMFPIYCTPGTQYSFGLPFIIPAQIRPAEGFLFGRVPGFGVWS